MPVSAYAVSFVDTDVMGFLKNTIWKAFPDIILHSSVAKISSEFENDSVSKNGHKIKITPPNLMILASFSSAED